jgi:glutaryl-CoA dehydrogenase
VSQISPKPSFDWSAPRLDQQLTEDECSVREAAAAYCQEKLAPSVLKAFRTEETDASIFRETGELGSMIPEQYGVAGLNYVCCSVVAREMVNSYKGKNNLHTLILGRTQTGLVAFAN